MTLYNYVKDRDELEGLIAEAVLADVKLPPPSDDWLVDVRSIATAVWESMRRHPNAVPLVLTRRTVSSEGFAPAERLIVALSGGGLADLTCLPRFVAVLSLGYGGCSGGVGQPVGRNGREQANAARPERVGEPGRPGTPAHGGTNRQEPKSSMSADSTALSTCCWRESNPRQCISAAAGVRRASKH